MVSCLSDKKKKKGKKTILALDANSNPTKIPAHYYIFDYFSKWGLFYLQTT
jgi:hypothetical protein